MASIFGVKQELIVILPRQEFEYLRQALSRQALEILEPASSEKKNEKYVSSIKTPGYRLLKFLKVCGMAGTHSRR